MESIKQVLVQDLEIFIAGLGGLDWQMGITTTDVSNDALGNSRVTASLNWRSRKNLKCLKLQVLPQFLATPSSGRKLQVAWPLEFAPSGRFSSP